MANSGYPKINLRKTGMQIKLFMQVENLSVKELQNHLGLCAPQAIYKWLRGENLPSVDNLFALSKLLGVPIDALLVEEGQNVSMFYPSPHKSHTQKPFVSYHFLNLKAA